MVKHFISVQGSWASSFTRVAFYYCAGRLHQAGRRSLFGFASTTSIFCFLELCEYDKYFFFLELCEYDKYCLRRPAPSCRPAQPTPARAPARAPRRCTCHDALDKDLFKELLDELVDSAPQPRVFKTNGSATKAFVDHKL